MFSQVLVDQNAGPDSAALGAALRARAAVAVPGTVTSPGGEGGSAAPPRGRVCGGGVAAGGGGCRVPSAPVSLRCV